MKKIIIALVLILILAVSGVTSGQASAKENQKKPNIKKEQIKNFALQAKRKNKIIRENQTKIKKFQHELNDQVIRLKSMIRKIKNNPGTLDAGRLNAIKDIIASIDQSQQELKSTEGMLSTSSKELKLSRRNHDSQAFLERLDYIIAVQEKRIRALSALFSDINRFSKQLE